MKLLWMITLLSTISFSTLIQEQVGNDCESDVCLEGNKCNEEDGCYSWDESEFGDESDKDISSTYKYKKLKNENQSLRQENDRLITCILYSVCYNGPYIGRN